MNSITFYLQFYRPPKSGAQDPPAVASGGVQSTLITPGGVVASLTPLAGMSATLNNSFALNQDGSLFFEWGTVTFGDSEGQLSFAGIGPGYVLGQPDPASPMEQGTVMWKITGGFGFFAGATGAIVSNFLVNPATGELVDNHLYLVYLPN